MPRLAEPQSVLKVQRSELRQNQSRVLRQASGRNIVQVTGRGGEDEKYVVDKAYFDALLEQFKSIVETLQIVADQALFQRILKGAATVDEDLRHGRLHSLDEAFGENTAGVHNPVHR
jgi:hypothetical protein